MASKGLGPLPRRRESARLWRGWRCGAAAGEGGRRVNRLEGTGCCRGTGPHSHLVRARARVRVRVRARVRVVVTVRFRVRVRCQPANPNP